jgi:hypothetical protein
MRHPYRDKKVVSVFGFRAPLQLVKKPERWRMSEHSSKACGPRFDAVLQRCVLQLGYQWKCVANSMMFSSYWCFYYNCSFVAHYQLLCIFYNAILVRSVYVLAWDVCSTLRSLPSMFPSTCAGKVF